MAHDTHMHDVEFDEGNDGFDEYSDASSTEPATPEPEPNVPGIVVPGNEPRSPGQRLIEDAIDRLMTNQDKVMLLERRSQNDLWKLENIESILTSGDTLIKVDFPPATHASGCSGAAWGSVAFRMHSAKLLATGSSVFMDMLTEKRQARALKRHKKPLPNGVLYVLDLTPPREGDELASQIAELSLPASVMNWWLSNERVGVSGNLVLGHDDNCPDHAKVTNSCNKSHPPDTSEDLPKVDLDDILPTPSRQLEDYCPIRHCVNILRIMLAINGEDLVIDSAPRLFTLAAISKIFDCASVVRDQALVWLLAQPNTQFTEIHPEVAIHIAWLLNIRDVTKAAFRILVVERAFEALGVAQPEGNSQRNTIWGRPRDALPDELENVVQHATLKLAERVQEVSAKLSSETVFSYLGISEWADFMAIGAKIGCSLPNSGMMATFQPSPGLPPHKLQGIAELQDSYYRLSRALLAYVQTFLTGVTQDGPNPGICNTVNRNRKCYVPRSSRVATEAIYKSLSFTQRLLTPWPWDLLNNIVANYNSYYYWKDVNTGSVRLGDLISNFNSKLALNANQGCFPELKSPHSDVWRFSAVVFHEQLHDKIGKLSMNWARVWLEVPFERTSHLALGLTDEEFKYLPLWADGLDDGTGGVFDDEAVPDTHLGAIGPGPMYHTGASIPSDVSSIAHSFSTVSGTMSGASTATATAGRSVWAVHSNATPSTFAPSSVMTPSDTGSEAGGVAGDLTSIAETDTETEAWSVVNE